MVDMPWSSTKSNLNDELTNDSCTAGNHTYVDENVDLFNALKWILPE